MRSTAKPLYTVYKTAETGNKKENMGKKQVLRCFQKQVLSIGAEVVGNFNQFHFSQHTMDVASLSMHVSAGFYR